MPSVQSDLVKINLAMERVVLRHKGVGRLAHGVQPWGGFLAVLDSGRGALVLVDAASGAVTPVWQVHHLVFWRWRLLSPDGEFTSA